MGCGSQSKVQNTVNKIKQPSFQLNDIQNIIDQNLNDLNKKKPQELIEQIEKEDMVEKQNKEKTLNINKSDGSQSQSSQNSSPKATQATISSKQDILLLNQTIFKHSDVMYTEILKKEVFKISSNIKQQPGMTYDNKNNNINQAKRIQNEIRILVKNLPIFSTNSIFVRCNQLDTNHFQCLIMGSKDTPYAYGAFIFDLYCDHTFPSSPPKMKLLTTGGGTVRFNPNLYSDGYICLSLLGTWSGNKNEKWSESSSNILQILLSIQSLVMNEGVYYNEPSIGKKSTENEQRNRAYKNLVKLGNIKHAMLGQLRNPDPVFADVIKTHFYLNKNELLKECDQWILDAKSSDGNNTKYDNFVRSHNPNQSARYKADPSLYAKDLIDIVYDLKQELNFIDLSTIPIYQSFIENLKGQEEEQQQQDNSDSKIDPPAEEQEVNNNNNNSIQQNIEHNLDQNNNKIPHLNEYVC